MSSGYDVAMCLLDMMWPCVFWIPRGGCCIHELTAAVVTGTKLTHDKASQCSSMGGEGVPEASPIPAALGTLLVVPRGEIIFLSGIVIGKLPTL